MANRCISCGNPCGYTGLFSSADCSNVNCEYATKEAPSLAPTGPDDHAHTLKPVFYFNATAAPAAGHYLAPKAISKVWNFTPLHSELVLLDERARLMDVVRWLAGKPDPAKGDDLWIGLWDEGYVGRPPDSHSCMPDCFTLQEYSRGAEGWVYGSVTKTFSNTKPYTYKETIQNREVTHVVLGDSKWIHFCLPLPRPRTLIFGDTFQIHPGYICFL